MLGRFTALLIILFYFLPMRRFSIFCIWLLQIILFAQPTLSERARSFVNLNDFLQQRDGMLKLFEWGVTQPTKHCPEIKYSLDSMPFLIVPCFDKSSQELDITLKVGNVDLGQEKGTFDTEILISFDHGQLLNGEHRYYLKDDYLWLHYDNIIFGKKHTGDQRLNSVPSGFISSEDATKPKTEEDTPKPKPKEDGPKPKPKKDRSKSKPKEDASKPKEDAPKSKPKKDAPKSKSRYEL